MKNKEVVKNLRIINFAVLLQQQRYIVAISYLFYMANGLTLSDFLFFQSIFYFTGLIAEIPAGYIGDILPRKNILIFSYSLFIIRILLWIAIPNYYTILIGEILFGLSKSFYDGVSDGYIYDYLKENNLKEQMLNNYGKFNFFMSTGSAISCLVGAFLYKFVGFNILLSFELFCCLIAITLLTFLPQVQQHAHKTSFNLHIKKILIIIKDTCKNQKITTYMLYAGILSGLTSVFVWNFQPFMKSFAVPVILFGVVYFFNHMTRAFCSMKAGQFLKQISLANLGWLVGLFYSFCFFISFYTLNVGNMYLCIVVLITICAAIGFQMVFNIGNISRIHEKISSNKRATVSSFNSMLGSLFSGTLLMFCKFVSDRISIQISLFIFMIITIFITLIMKQVLKKNET